MGRTTSNNGRPQLRVVGFPPENDNTRKRSKDVARAPKGASLVTGVKLARIGATIVDSLVEDGSRSAIRIPNGVGDVEALNALSTLQQQTKGRDLFSYNALRLLELWALEHRSSPCHRRTYGVDLFVEATAGKSAREASRELGKAGIEPGMRLVAGDPMEVALVLAAHIIRHNGETPARHFELRTANPRITFAYVDLRGELVITNRAPETRHDLILTAGSPAPIPRHRGLLSATREALGLGAKRSK